MSPRATSGDATRAKLVTAATEALRHDGIAGLSARGVATRAGVNQALVFYHFGTLAALVDHACRESADSAVARYRDQLAGVGTFRELLDVGRRLHVQQQAEGNVAIMAQLMAGAQRDEALAVTARYCLDRWNAEMESAVRRVLARGPFQGLVEPEALARSVSAAFLGLELYEGVDPAASGRAFDALERLGEVLEVVDELGPVARRAVRARLRRREQR